MVNFFEGTFPIVSFQQEHFHITCVFEETWMLFPQFKKWQLTLRKTWKNANLTCFEVVAVEYFKRPGKKKNKN